MMKSIQESPLYPIANPGSIAFFGASNNLSSMGTILISSLLSTGYEGPLYPVHPKESRVQNLKAYRNVLDLPEVPDLAILVLPTGIVNQTMIDCARKGIKHAIVVSAGFKELGEQGVELEEELSEIADRYGLRILGPNCIGVVNPHKKLNTTPFVYEAAPGFIGLASQSGSFVTQMFSHLSTLGLGYSMAFSVGNEANVDIVDCMEYLGACPNTKVIALYIEGIKRGRAFVDVARSIVPHKPIVAFYVGGSETGKRAGLSHTGALAGPDLLYDGVFRQSGVIRATSITEMFDFCWVLGSVPIPHGPKVVIQTHSGGPGAAAADACGRAGLELPSLSPETLDRLTPFVPRTAVMNNPVDITFFGRAPANYLSEIPGILLKEKNMDILLLYALMPGHLYEATVAKKSVNTRHVSEEIRNMVKADCETVARLNITYGKPVVGYTAFDLEEDFIRGLLDRGFPVFPSPERAANALGTLIQYSRMRDRIVGSMK